MDKKTYNELTDLLAQKKVIEEQLNSLKKQVNAIATTITVT